MKDLDKYRGCLIGGAVGNALGYAVEFLPDSAIFQRYGERGITEYERIDGVAQISDDTQMTLFTANGLLLGTTRRMSQGEIGSYPFYIGLCYKDWLKTQSAEDGCSTPDHDISIAPSLILYSKHILVIATYNIPYCKREINHKNIDAVETAGRFGIAADQAVDYVLDSAGTELNFWAMSRAVSCYRSVGAVPMASLDMIRKDMKKQGKR